MYTLEMKSSVGKRKILFVFLAVIVLGPFLVSCKKGDTGPAGPAGAPGAEGPAGSANVIYSAWFTPSPWTKDTIFNIYGFNFSKTTTDISQAILDSGTVITFGKLEGYNPLIWPTGQVSQLPIVLNYRFSPGGTTYTDTWSALATLNKIKIRFVDDQNYYGSIATSHQFRYIVIPGGQKATTAAATGAGVLSRNGRTMDAAAYNASVREVARSYQQMSYAEICDRLGVPQ